VGHIQNGHPHPFEVWVNGEEQPRGIGALAKSLSMDMRSEDQGWLKAKLDALAKTAGQPFEMRMPGDSSQTVVASEVSALARLVSHRCNELGVFETLNEQLFSPEAPLLNAMFSTKEPKSGTDGTLSWTVDVSNPATGDDFALFLKELVLPDGSHRPYSMWLSGEYPNAFVGLCKSLSLDMRVVDPAWIGKKLRSLKSFPEPQGDFMARVPGHEKMENQPSTVAYIARLIIHRYQMLGILDADGYPVTDMGIFDHPSEPAHKNTTFSIMAGKLCSECGVKAVIKKDGCDFCSACGAIGACG
jgi:ribonucleoside-diphosphate reductase alpha chain